MHAIVKRLYKSQKGRKISCATAPITARTPDKGVERAGQVTACILAIGCTLVLLVVM